MKNYSEIFYCAKCLMPSSRPRITFKDKVCNACILRENQKKINWEKDQMN